MKTIEYKCRRCGKVESPKWYDEQTTGDVLRLHMNEGITAAKFCEHKCPDGGTGLMDLIGTSPG